MFPDGAYMVGMCGSWWMFWLIMVMIFLFSGRGRSGRWGYRTREVPHDLLLRRLTSGDVTPSEYEDGKILLDRYGVQPV